MRAGSHPHPILTVLVLAGFVWMHRFADAQETGARNESRDLRPAVLVDDFQPADYVRRDEPQRRNPTRRVDNLPQEAWQIQEAGGIHSRGPRDPERAREVWGAFRPKVGGAVQPAREHANQFRMLRGGVFVRAGVSNQPTAATLVQADRGLIQRWKQARELIDQQKFGDAADLLQRILDVPEDSFFLPDPKNKTLLRSLKTAAQDLIGSLPPEGKIAYELRFGTSARRLLTDALAAGDPDRFAEVARRYFHTEAGYEAAYRLGVAHFDRAEPLAAALCFERLRKAGDPAKKREPMLSLRTALCWNRVGVEEQADRVLSELKDSGVRAVTLRGREVPLFKETGGGRQWLTQVFGWPRAPAEAATGDWKMFGGNPARNAVGSSAAPPAATRWEVSTVFDPLKDPTQEAPTEADEELTSTVKTLLKQQGGQRRATLPQLSPIAVNDTVYVRTVGNILAVDLASGKTRWPTQGDTTLEQLLPGYPLGFARLAFPNRQNYLSLLVGQRIYSDATNGRMSSDGEFLYAVEETGFWGTIYNSNTQTTIQPREYNTLVAYHCSSVAEFPRIRASAGARPNSGELGYPPRPVPGAGKRAWAVGGAAGDPLFELPLAGTFFLGAPLPLGGRLYCLADVNGEIRLLVLDPHNEGRLEWSQSLAAAEPVSRDVSRRLAGTTPSHADGILVCPTDAGSLVAVDLTGRSLLWGYRVETTANAGANQPHPNPFARQRRPGPQPMPVGGPAQWTDSVALIADGKVLVTPQNSDQLFCLRLIDGGLVWKKPRGDGLYVAGVVDGKVLVVGTGKVQAWRLSDGAWAWEEPTIIAPSGRGVIHGRRLLVPLSTGELAVIDAATGKIVQKEKQPDGRVLGNLIVARGALISQSPEAVVALPLPKMDED